MSFRNIDDLEHSERKIEDTLIYSFKKCCPVSKFKGKKIQRWRNDVLQALRKDPRKAFRKTRCEDGDRVIDDLMTVKDTSRLRKFLYKQDWKRSYVPKGLKLFSYQKPVRFNTIPQKTTDQLACLH